MVSKKLKLLLALAGLMQTASYAQDSTHMSSTSGSTDDNWVFDSSKISTKNMPQHNEFVNYQNPYPPKPRSKWELSFGGGNAIVIGDRPILHKGDKGASYVGGITGSISARFPISHVFSGRLGYMGSLQKIPSYKVNAGPVYIPYSANASHAFNADLIASLNTISSSRGNPKTNIYVFVGYSIAATRISKGDKGFFKYDGLTDRDVYVADNNNLISTFNNKDANGVGSQALYHNVDFGGGLAFKLSSKVNLAFEERISSPLTGVDILDGYVGSKGNGISADKMAYSTVKLNFNLGNSATHTEPLWWINPNNYIYNEVATPKHMKLPPVILPDADGDGVTDQFDMEPNTPAGCTVDVHGVSLDTDGDDVPDCRDKEKLTPQNCFPVNADGVGTCSEPECCSSTITTGISCFLGSLPSVQFKNGSASLSSTAKSLLDNVAQQMTANPNCKVKLVGYGASDKRTQQLSWDHVNAIKTYLTQQQGISETRVIFTYGMDGNGTTVDLVPTTEEGPNTVPAPHPNLRNSESTESTESNTNVFTFNVPKEIVQTDRNFEIYIVDGFGNEPKIYKNYPFRNGIYNINEMNHIRKAEGLEEMIYDLNKSDKEHIYNLNIGNYDYKHEVILSPLLYTKGNYSVYVFLKGTLYYKTQIYGYQYQINIPTNHK